MYRRFGFIPVVILLLSGSPLVSAQGTVMPAIHQLQQSWAHIKYELPPKQREAAYQALAKQAAALVKARPQAAEPRVWQAIALSSYAGEKGGLGALGLVKQAKALLEQAEKIDPQTLRGSIYVTLGSLYYKVPGWPIGFGDDDKARNALNRALVIAPDSMGANFFMADFLFDQGDRHAAVPYLQKVIAAPAVAQRPVYTRGRKREAQQLLEQITSQQAHNS